MNKIDEIGMRGPVNGMGEADLRGSYFAIALTFEDDEFVRGRITLAQVETLRDLCNHFLSVNGPGPTDARGEIASWMIAKGIATGHGDTLDDLLRTLVLHCSDHARAVTANRYGEASEQWQAGFESGGSAAANAVREIIVPQQPCAA